MIKKFDYKKFIGKKFGKWKILNYKGFVKSSNPKFKSHRIYYFKCICNCGNIRLVPLNNLTSGRSKGCQSCAAKKHGLAGTYLYGIWSNLMRKNKERNIQVSKQWFVIKKFINDVNKHLGPRPSKKHKFVLKDYSKGFIINNVKWGFGSKKFV